jgi:hypothetical protein
LGGRAATLKYRSPTKSIAAPYSEPDRCNRRDDDELGASQGLAGAPVPEREFEIHEATVMGNRVYVGYGTSSDGVCEILDRDAIVIGDGGDFVSYAGRVIETFEPGCWMDPGPFGCLGVGAAGPVAVVPEAVISGPNPMETTPKPPYGQALQAVGLSISNGRNGRRASYPRFLPSPQHIDFQNESQFIHRTSEI